MPTTSAPQPALLPASAAAWMQILGPLHAALGGAQRQGPGLPLASKPSGMDPMGMLQPNAWAHPAMAGLTSFFPSAHGIHRVGAPAPAASQKPGPSVSVVNASRASITKEVLSSVYHLPQAEAAQALNTSVRKIKQLCGQYNINRWPHRALQSLDKLCQLVQEEADKTPSESSVREGAHRSLLNEVCIAMSILYKCKA